MKDKIILMGTDTISGIAPEIVEAIIAASKVQDLPYGNDDFTKQSKIIISNVFEKKEIEIIPMMSGTASNSLALSSFLRSYGSILCHSESHINNDEGGAPEFFSGGGKLLEINNANGRLNAKDIELKINLLNLKGKINSKISGVSITQLAENGTTYDIDEIKAISDVCKKNKLFLHMDGARFANALAFQNNISPAEASWKSGVDCLSLGATKNGAMAAEVIIFFNTDLAQEARNRVKQTGHLLSKTRFISAQLNAWFKNGLWLNLAKLANQKAIYLNKKISKLEEFNLLHPTEGNEVFFKIHKDTYEKILKLNVFPNLWCYLDNEMLVIRFVTSFETKCEDIEEIVSRLYANFNLY